VQSQVVQGVSHGSILDSNVGGNYAMGGNQVRNNFPPGMVVGQQNQNVQMIGAQNNNVVMYNQNDGQNSRRDLN
jgi:hypothetical protein